MERLNKNNFVKLARQIHGNKYDYGKTIYVKAKEKVVITCPKHGDFEQRPQDHILKACGCPKCKGEKITQVHSYTFQEFLKLAKEKFGDKYDYSKANYENYQKTPITIVCPIHGEFQTIPRTHITSITGCPKCGREKANESESSNTEEFIKRASKVHYNKYDYSKVEYIRNSEKVCIICPRHGEFWQTPANHLQGQGCPKCKLNSQSKVYGRLKEKFPNLDIIFEATNKVIPWIGSQRIDIYIPSLNIAIEYNGIQHYQEVEFFGGGGYLFDTQQRDNIKRQKCSENNCLLIELKYNYTDEDFQSICNIISKQLEVHNEDTSLMKEVV